MQKIDALLKEHTDREDERFTEIKSEIRTIKENHLAHIESDIQSLKIQGASLTTDMGWVKWGILAILGALIAGSLSLLFIK